ncbi:class I SAM-dependent methyltransferase [candidate division WOR-3 bacterium]|nr:class I SAM-dependent methyltransferase [candidate division WOR-3 bacterium]
MNKYVLLNRMFYDYNASFFSSSRSRAELDKILKFCRLLPASGFYNVLDLGCGEGKLLFYFSEFANPENFYYIGIDQSLQMIKKGISSLGRVLNAGFINAYVSSDFLKTIDIRFSLVAALGLFHHIPDQKERENIVNQICRLTGKDGTAVISLWNFETSKIRILANVKDKSGTPKKGDYLLGYANSRIPRFCHSFDSEEIGEIRKIFKSRGFETRKFRIIRNNNSCDFILWAKNLSSN